MVSVSELELPLDVRWSELPVVEVSYDIGALAEVPDPSGFFEERDVVVK